MLAHDNFSAVWPWRVKFEEEWVGIVESMAPSDCIDGNIRGKIRLDATPDAGRGMEDWGVEVQ